MSSRADREAPWAPDVSSHCPTAAEHTPAYCPETETSAAATPAQQNKKIYIHITFSKHCSYTGHDECEMNECGVMDVPIKNPLPVYFKVQMSKN